MKTLQPDFASHIASGATTLATCWRLRRQDGIELGFTDHDVSLTFDGTTFLPTAGADGSELTGKSGSVVDTSEILGVLSSTTISDDDIRLGRYDGAIVEIWRVNWRNPATRDLLRRDTIGEITCEDSFFKAELRSPELALNIEKGRLYQCLCGTNLGEAPCGIDLQSAGYQGSGVVVAVSGQNQVEVSGLSGFAAEWFLLGKVVWSSGQRNAVTDRIVAQSLRGANDLLTLETDVADWVAVGDTLTIFAGCNRQFSTCRDKFQNHLNFRGFPHVPGSDFILKYPKDGDVLAGTALIK